MYLLPFRSSTAYTQLCGSLDIIMHLKVYLPDCLILFCNAAASPCMLKFLGTAMEDIKGISPFRGGYLVRCFVVF